MLSKLNIFIWQLKNELKGNSFDKIMSEHLRKKPAFERVDTPMRGMCDTWCGTGRLTPLLTPLECKHVWGVRSGFYGGYQMKMDDGFNEDECIHCGIRERY